MNRFGERSARRELLCEPQVEGIEHHRTSEHRGGRPGYKATKNSVSADWRIAILFRQRELFSRRSVCVPFMAHTSLSYKMCHGTKTHGSPLGRPHACDLSGKPHGRFQRLYVPKYQLPYRLPLIVSDLRRLLKSLTIRGNLYGN